MTSVEFSVFAVMALLALASLLLPLAQRLNLPYTVLLALLGAVLGLVLGGVAETPGPAGTGGAAPFSGIHVGSDTLLYLFLPALLFAAGLAVDGRRLMDDLGPVVLLAVVAVLVCTAFAGLALDAVTSYGLVACLALGSIVATTDAAAVVAVFRDIGAPRRLSIIVEGESLFNDAAAIALFSVLAGLLATSAATPDAGAGAVIFVRGLVGGLVFGYVAARLVIALIGWMQGSPLTEISLTIALAYLTFVVAEIYLEVSGVIAVVTAAMVLASDGRTRLGPESWESLRGTWRLLEFVATSLVFILAAMAAPRVLMEVRPADVNAVLVLFGATLAARIFVLYALSPLLSLCNLAAPIPGRYKAVLVWGGLRGAVTVALALAVSERAGIPEDIRRFILVTAMGYVLLTLFVQAPSLRPMMRALRLDRFSSAERQLRDRVVALTRRSVREQVHDLAQRAGLAASLRDMGPLGAQIDKRETLTLSTEERLRTGLLVLAARESELVLDYFRRGLARRQVVDKLRADAGRVLDGAHTGGVDGYLVAAIKFFRASFRYRAARWAQRRLGLNGPLARVLGERMEVLVVKDVILRELREETLRSIAALVGGKTAAELEKVIDRRTAALRSTLHAFELQYPSFARDLHLRFLQRVALAFEHREYARHLTQAVISTEVYDDLDGNVRARRAALDDRLHFDLGLRLRTMLAKVPAFCELETADLAYLGRMLTPVLAMPGEPIIKERAAGDRMYFIATGEVEVRRPDRTVRLGAGDFFGEIALLTGQRRNADVVAVTFCSLLELRRRDLRRFLARTPHLRAHLEAAAKARMGR